MHRGELIGAIVDGSEVVTYEVGPTRGQVVVRETPEGLRYYYRGPMGVFPLDVVRQKIAPWMTLLTAMFMHAGLLHLVGNMWFLFVFGPSLEDSLGKLPYVAFYLATGLGATAAQLVHDPASSIPFLGASGAIAGVMGGFAVRFPGANVLTLIPIILYTLAHLPAWIFMLIYLGEQVFMSLVHTQENGGVAWWAHIGGFAAGYLVIRFFPVRGPWKEIFRREREHPEFP
jgi:membrane associated rhomboid family serine protease